MSLESFQAAQAADINCVAAIALIMLRDAGVHIPPTQSAMARQAGVSDSAMSQQVRRLEDMGLITHERRTEHYGRRTNQLTDAGRELAKRL